MKLKAIITKEDIRQIIDTYVTDSHDTVVLISEMKPFEVEFNIESG